MKTDKSYLDNNPQIFAFEGVCVAINFQRDCSIDIYKHLGYRDYFRVVSSILKIIGSLILIAPSVPMRFKEWTYVGFAIDYFFALFLVIDGFGADLLFPIFMIGVLASSFYFCFKLRYGHFKFSYAN